MFGGVACVDVGTLAVHRGLDPTRLANLLMQEKTIALPFEDPITYGVNAAKPIIDRLSAEEKRSIELLITCTESGIDFGKSMSTYIHDYLGLSKNCRVFELKQACYSGTAGLQMATNFILSQTVRNPKALVIATDISRFMIEPGSDRLSEDWRYAEPSAGAGAVAMLVSDHPEVFEMDVGAAGYYTYEVMDTCRPAPDSEAGDADLSLLSYLDCCEQSFLDYCSRVEGADFKDTFDFLAFHAPFGGMVKGAHRTMMRKLYRAKPADIEADYDVRVGPGLTFCGRVGNIMGGTLFLSLVGTISHEHSFAQPRRVGCFSYGSGCCSEFFSGVVRPGGAQLVASREIGIELDGRYRLSMSEYDNLLFNNSRLKFGTRDAELDIDAIPGILHSLRSPHLVLSRIKGFHREYEWS